MKKAFTIILLSFAAISCSAQLKLSAKDLDNLIALSELYSHNNMCHGYQFVKSADSLRTSMLNNMIDALIATGKEDTSILQKRFLIRPSNDELILWYVLREIHYNRGDTSRKRRSDMDVTQDILTNNIDERWLLDNYYYRVRSGLSMFFNDGDLSGYNFDLNNLGFKNETEKAIFFYNMMDALAIGRFRVLQYLKKKDKIIAMSNKLPSFNGKKYYYYINLDIPDFDWIGYDKKESYKQRHIGDLLETLLIQFSTLASTGDKSAAREVYFNSILYKPEYFKYSELKDTLQKFYDASKQ